MIKIKAVGDIEEEKVETTLDVLNASDGEILTIIITLINFYIEDEHKTYDEVMKMIKEAYEYAKDNI